MLVLLARTRMPLAALSGIWPAGRPESGRRRVTGRRHSGRHTQAGSTGRLHGHWQALGPGPPGRRRPPSPSPVSESDSKQAPPGDRPAAAGRFRRMTL